MTASTKMFVSLALGLTASACVSGNYTRNIQNLPALERAQSELPQSGIGLERCLEVMGAPNWIFEHQVHGLLLVYAWDHQSQWTASFSVPAGDSASASFSVSNLKRNQQGVVLWLDANWELTEWKHGYLHTLVGSDLRPATLDQLESD